MKRGRSISAIVALWPVAALAQTAPARPLPRIPGHPASIPSTRDPSATPITTAVIEMTGLRDASGGSTIDTATLRLTGLYDAAGGVTVDAAAIRMTGIR